MQKKIAAVLKIVSWVVGVFIIIVVLGILAIVIFYGEREEDLYAIRLNIENNTNHRVFAVMLPVVTYKGDVIDNLSTSYDWRVVSPTLTPESQRTTVSVEKPPKKVLGRINTEQIRLEPHLAYDIDYYLGKNVHFEDLRIIVVAWFADSGWDSNLIQSPPDRFYTLYNPKHVIGPETYELFGRLVIE